MPISRTPILRPVFLRTSESPYFLFNPYLTQRLVRKVTPLGALPFTLVHLAGFGEQGSLLRLQIRSDTQASLRTDLGARASYTWHLGKTVVIPTVTVAWEHEYLYTVLPKTVGSTQFPGSATSLVTGLVVVSYVLNSLRPLVPEATATLDWRLPPVGTGRLMLFEAFITDQRETDDSRHIEHLVGPVHDASGAGAFGV